MWKGRALRKRLCRPSTKAAGKLESLGAKGQAHEGNPIKASIEQITITHSINATKSPYSIDGTIFNKPVTFLIDTGSAISLLDSAVWDQVRPPEATLSPWSGTPLVGVSGEHLQILGTAEVTIELANNCFPLRLVVVNDLTAKAIIGLDFLEEHNCNLAVGERLLHIPSCKAPILVSGSKHCCTPTQMCASIAATEVVPAYSELEVMATIPQNCKGKSLVVETINTKATESTGSSHN